MPRAALEQLFDQDKVLERLGMWPFEGRSMKQLNAEEREEIYRKRKTLSRMLPVVKLPGEEGRKYLSTDIEALIQRSRAIAA